MPAFQGEGYNETQVDENVFRVSFHGNGATPADYAEDMTLLRSAEVSKQHGFDFFVIITGVSRSDGTETVGSSYASTKQTSKNSASAFGIGSSFSSNKPSTTNTIVCFKSKPDNFGGLVYSADFLIKSMSAKYVIPREEDRSVEAMRYKRVHGLM
jgi:hypothetical protein